MKEQAIAALVGPVVERCGLEVDRIETVKAGQRTLLRVFLDGDGPLGGGPSLDQIAEATRAISAALDASPATGSAPYTLEVSTRGATRPLTDPKHFRRNEGRLVALTLREGRANGRIAGTDAEGVVLEAEDGTQHRVPFEDITKAVVQVELRKGTDEGLDDEEE